MNKVVKVCVSGSWQLPTTDEFADVAQVIGQTLAELGCELWTGGGTGFPDRVARSYLEHAGEKYVWVKVDEEAMREVGEEAGVAATEVIETHENYPRRNITLIESVDMLVACTGSLGTLQEICFAVKDEKIPTVIYLPSFQFDDALGRILKGEDGVSLPTSKSELADKIRQAAKGIGG